MTGAYIAFAVLLLLGFWVIDSFGDTEIGPRAQANLADMIGVSFTLAGFVGLVVTGGIHLWITYV